MADRHNTSRLIKSPSFRHLLEPLVLHDEVVIHEEEVQIRPRNAIAYPIVIIKERPTGKQVTDGIHRSGGINPAGGLD
ncbi:hypothetical protein [Tunicatimonas pelagia]|uniref:hypothetical protein n=1 Tax=Tunicatimonas pelagia TaxID=931531 RepID=UPI002665BBA8|nr:hypothetical protein [Tunicatimonas pelagia]WKN43944.1 hypothetical protein P0M28_03030 [Tunicatimonas pelagia]